MIDKSVVLYIHNAGQSIKIVADSVGFNSNVSAAINNEIKETVFDMSKFLKEKYPALSKLCREVFEEVKFSHYNYSNEDTILLIDRDMKSVSYVTNTVAYPETYKEAIEDYLEKAQDHFDDFITTVVKGDRNNQIKSLLDVGVIDKLIFKFNKMIGKPDTVVSTACLSEDDGEEVIRTSYQTTRENFIVEFENAKEILSNFINEQED